jgi:hypothetical protein
MPKVAIAETFRDWDKLLTAAAELAASVPGLAKHLAALTLLNQRVRELEALRIRLQAERQRATQDLHAAREEGKVAAMQVRLALKAAFGHADEGLVAFNIRPRRSRRSRRPVAPTPAPAVE